MRTPRFGSNFALFVLFFGVSALDAVAEGSWLRSLFWAAIAVIFLLADRRQEA
ncbi:MAG TPA: hypothetical protein VFQ76_02550 [Longimicrobiaceae bacterium]|nr:hypothetical protein [Longimicrobiaceae bacterium]